MYSSRVLWFVLEGLVAGSPDPVNLTLFTLQTMIEAGRAWLGNEANSVLMQWKIGCMALLPLWIEGRNIFHLLLVVFFSKQFEI